MSVLARQHCDSISAGDDGGGEGGRGDGKKPGGGVGNWLELLGLVPFGSVCGLPDTHAEKAWPKCAGVPALVLQQAVLHLLCVLARLSRYLERRSATAACAATACASDADAASAAAAAAADAGEILDSQLYCRFV